MSRVLRCPLVLRALLLLLVPFGLPSARGQFDYPRRPSDTTVLEKMRGGTAKVSDSPKNEDLLNDQAIWLAHRLVHPPFNGKEPDKKSAIPESLETLLDEVDRACSWPNQRQPPNAAQMEYAKAFGKVLSTKIMDVYNQTDKKLEKVNAARMLAVAGKLPYEGLADIYLNIIRDNSYPDEIKLFAFHGLRNLLAIPDPNFPAKHFIATLAKLAEISKELEKYITHKCAPGLSAEQARVIQYIRREAVRALAQVKVSVVRQQNEVLTKPIVTLLRVATNDKYVSPAEAALPGHGYSMMEQIEAVIGIGNMLPDKDLNLDVVAWMLNDAMDDISKFQAKERTDFQRDERNKPLIPWRITAVHLSDAFTALKKNVASLAPRLNPKFAIDYADIVLKITTKLETEGVKAQPDYSPFNGWKRDPARRPKATQLLNGDDSTKVEIK